MGFNVRNDQERMMCDIGTVSFLLMDMALYLDTHPEDAESISTFLKLKDICKKHYDEYVRMYGPIRFTDVNCDNYWTWVSDPWPWEGGCA